MKIVSGISSLEEAKYFSKHSDELYFGVFHVENHRKWYSWKNISTWREAGKVVETAHGRGKKIHLAVNEVYHPETLPAVFKSIRHALGLGVDGLIVRDLALLELLKRKCVRAEIILSSTACCFNSGAAEFFSEFNISRIVVPQQVRPQEYAEVIAAHPGLTFEIFYLPDSCCANVDGICMYHEVNKDPHELSCRLPHRLLGRSFTMWKPSHKERLAMIYDFYALGTAYIKMTRDGSFEEKKGILRNISKLRELLSEGLPKAGFVRKAMECM